MSLNVAALIVAAGRSARMGGELPKQYVALCGRSVLARVIAAFSAHPMIRTVVVVSHPDDQSRFDAVCAEAAVPAGIQLLGCFGGDSRQASVANGLAKLASIGFADDGIVLIHDAARPLVSESLITRAISAGFAHGAAIPVLPVADTIAEVDATGHLRANPDRNVLRIVQTPQSFRFGLIREAHQAANNQKRADFTDDAGIIRWRNAEVATFPGDATAFKLTTREDLARAESLLAPPRPDFRIATGYDVHVFGPGDHIMLGGVRIPHDHGVVGHSDADVLLHALTDALLGCIADGDIGMHFPPTDMRWKGMASHIFLTEAVRRVKAKGGDIRHIDGTVICEAPRVGPHRDAIRSCIAEITGVEISRVSIKATTSEKLGFTGRREGIAAFATATVALS